MREIIGRNISILYRNENHYVDNNLRKLHLNKVQAEVLLQLIHDDGINLTRLNDYFLFNKATITKITSHLEKHNYIRRVICDKDRREKEIYLTNKGRNVLPEIKEVLSVWQQRLVNDIAIEDVDRIKSLLAQMVDNITRMEEDINE